ncbi:MAG: aspartate 1-decarboxylase [Elusimicrobia bacterium]|nr:aspartate 1-decarboxylase [Elusimicrobiota bacterium]
MRFYLRSKIHSATVTEARTDYIGSVTIDEDLIDRTGLEEGEKVSVWDIDNGERLETYVIKGRRSSGVICMNGAAALKIKKGHRVIIAGFELSEKKPVTKAVLVDKNNRFVKYLTEEEMENESKSRQ